MIRRFSIFAFGVASYLVFLATSLYAVGFLGGFLAPTTLDGAPRRPFAIALAIDLGLLALFAAQHSVMARPAFKRAWTRLVAPELERSIYVLAASLCLLALFALWQPLGGVVWSFASPWARAAAWAVFGFGWALVLLSTFLISHADLFGLRQVTHALRGEACPPIEFVERGAYRLIRHPLHLGWLCTFWGAPTMSGAHFVFALAATAYIRIAIRLEERDLLAEYGSAYEDYCRHVPMLLPDLPRRATSRGPSIAG